MANQPLIKGQKTLNTYSRDSLIEIWGQSLTMGKVSEPREAVLLELSEYFKISIEEAKEKCLHWKEYSAQEWNSGDRTTPEGLQDFYNNQTSWIFDTMWYHAAQYYGEMPAESVEIALGLGHIYPGKHLDFGAGPGSSSLFFYKLGWEVYQADISHTMQEFAKWRLNRHNVKATFYDTSREQLPDQTFDLITAFDVMVHIPNAVDTIRSLAQALQPGGYLVFNIDNQPLTPEIRSYLAHFYDQQYPILKHVRRLGFRKCAKISYFHVYQRVNRGKVRTKFLGTYDILRYNKYVNVVTTLARMVLRRLRH
ncbi:MAG: class I SAM-dependent methyltransferase [Chloroflexi bacterium]|nr:class I SAM-dependent methyltransferase [Chloroflexota bacterium]OJV92996.1 MAG: hypothetical protein BGO39_21000 [Chloroflexi bacterium 54-19]